MLTTLPAGQNGDGRGFSLPSGHSIFSNVERYCLALLSSEMEILKQLVTRRRRILFRVYLALTISLTLIPAPQLTAQTAGKEPDRKTSQAADAFFQKGMHLLREKRYGEAIEQFRLLEKEAPQNNQGLSGEGIALALMGKPQEAIEALKKALAIDPNDWVARRELGIVYWSQGLKQEAAQELEPVVRLHPDDGPVNVILGQVQFEHENYAQALVYLLRVPAQVVADPHLSLIEAEAQLKTGQTDEAGATMVRLVGRPGLTQGQTFELAWLLGQARLFKEAIGVFGQLPRDFPDEFRHNYGLALAYFGDEQYEKCASQLKALLPRANTSPALFGLLGVAEEKSGHTKEAYDTFRQGILNNPEDPQNYLNIATLACEHLNYDLAAEILTSGIERMPNSHKLFLSRGIARTLKSEFTLAQRDYDRAIELAPGDSGSYLAKGLSQLEKGDLDGAIQSLKESSQREARDPQSLYFIAEALIQKGVSPGTASFDQAKQATDMAISLDPSFAYAYRNRAKLELQAGDTDRAIADLERARAVDPKSSSIAYLLARTYQQAGRASQAEALFGQVREESEREVREFRRDSLTQALVVISQGDH